MDWLGFPLSKVVNLFLKTPFIYLFTLVIWLNLIFHDRQTTSMSIFISIVQNPPPPVPKKDLRSLPTRELLIWGDTDKVEVRKTGGIGVHNLSHSQKISVASITFYGHIISFTPPPCEKNKRKRYQLCRVHPNNRGWERERERNF